GLRDAEAQRTAARVVARAFYSRRLAPGFRRMTSHLLLPVLAQIALTLFMYIRLAGAKAGAIKRGEVDEARRALHEDAWPESVQKINNNIRNQFEVPVLFYVMALSLISLNAADMAALIT